MKLLILGSMRSGKDTCAEILQKLTGLKFVSSSEFANAKCVFPVLSAKYGYKTLEECFIDRVNHRKEWFNLINDYNKDDGTKLTKEILEVNDCYVGMRSITQFIPSEQLFDLIIWIDADERIGVESSKSMDIPKTVADIIIDNNGTEEQFKKRITALSKFIEPFVGF